MTLRFFLVHHTRSDGLPPLAHLSPKSLFSYLTLKHDFQECQDEFNENFKKDPTMDLLVGIEIADWIRQDGSLEARTTFNWIKPLKENLLKKQLDKSQEDATL